MSRMRMIKKEEIQQQSLYKMDTIVCKTGLSVLRRSQ